VRMNKPAHANKAAAQPDKAWLRAFLILTCVTTVVRRQLRESLSGLPSRQADAYLSCGLFNLVCRFLV
jgi:hypothetical protein